MTKTEYKFKILNKEEVEKRIALLVLKGYTTIVFSLGITIRTTTIYDDKGNKCRAAVGEDQFFRRATWGSKNKYFAAFCAMGATIYAGKPDIYFLVEQESGTYITFEWLISNRKELLPLEPSIYFLLLKDKVKEVSLDTIEKWAAKYLEEVKKN